MFSMLMQLMHVSQSQQVLAASTLYTVQYMLLLLAEPSLTNYLYRYCISERTVAVTAAQEALVEIRWCDCSTLRRC
jgi:hypothetical protein